MRARQVAVVEEEKRERKGPALRHMSPLYQKGKQKRFHVSARLREADGPSAIAVSAVRRRTDATL